MITVVVEYALPSSIGREECLEHFTNIAPGFRQAPILVNSKGFDSHGYAQAQLSPSRRGEAYHLLATP